MQFKGLLMVAALALFLGGLQDMCVRIVGFRNGSGIFITSNRVLTCAHLVWPTKDVLVNVGSSLRTGTLLYEDKSIDLAILEIDWENPKHVKKLQLNSEVGDIVYAVSSLGIYEDFITFGQISCITEDEIVVDMTIMPGMSGAGVFDRRGLLVGIVQQLYGDLDTRYGDFLMVVIPAAKIKWFLDRVDEWESGISIKKS